MTEKEKFDESLDFVTQNYRRGAFSASRAWARMRLPGVRPWWMMQWRGVAAAVAVVALAATACIYTWVVPGTADDVQPEPPVMQVAAPVSENRIERIEFSDEPLSVVVAEIERVYGVNVVNEPETGDYRVTLSYEGNAAELIETINELFGLNLEVQR